VRGQAVATFGVADGIRGEAASSSGRGVYGVNTATTGLAYGIYGLSSSTGGGSGVVGKAPQYGVIGEAASTLDYSLGVWGFASNSAGRTFGVCGRSASTEGTGVWGWATASTGSTCGVRGESASTDGTGVSGVAFATDGQTYGGWFRSASPSGRGVYGEAQDGFGIYGLGTVGVSGTTIYADGTGVMGVAVETTGSSIGVFGQTSSPSGYGVYSSGNFAASGTKSCVVKTSKGPAMLYCQESPENWFEDFGEGQLMNGRCHVELDPLFLETATINGANPMKVFITPDDPMCEGVAVVRSTTGFDVIELHGGEGSSSFAYRVVAKRKGYESRRLDYCQAAEKDSYLFPKLRDQEAGKALGVRGQAGGPAFQDTGGEPSSPLGGVQ
ncbi:hypothetical protein JXA88_09265, partial [Candidatus Fermentibacteria bacterium]|nr:hypothetical protein [Candidatus Fermentibacteria bacterium]